MSSLKTGTPAGSITFAFENLCILLESGERRVFGDVTIAFDGAGAYWPVAMRLHGSEPKSPVMHVRYGIGLWREIMRRVEQYHAADVARLINEQLEARGVHMALFDEHAATMGRRPVPPHVRPAARAAPLLTRYASARSTADDRADAARLAAIKAEIEKMFNTEELPPDGEIGDFDDPVFETMREVQDADLASLEQERDAIKARMARRALKLRQQKHGFQHAKAVAPGANPLVLAAASPMASTLVPQPQHGRHGVRISTLYAGQGR